MKASRAAYALRSMVVACRIRHYPTNIRYIIGMYGVVDYCDRVLADLRLYWIRKQHALGPAVGLYITSLYHDADCDIVSKYEHRYGDLWKFIQGPFITANIIDNFPDMNLNYDITNVTAIGASHVIRFPQYDRVRMLPRDLQRMLAGYIGEYELIYARSAADRIVAFTADPRWFEYGWVDNNAALCEAERMITQQYVYNVLEPLLAPLRSI